MNTPRIYTYKITFPCQKWWYWGVHKERRYGESYNGSPTTHKAKWDLYHYEKQILEFFDSYEEACKVEKRLIAPDINKPGCLNERVQGILSDEVRRQGGLAGGQKVVEEKLGFHSWTHEQWVEHGKRVGPISGAANGGSPNCAWRNPEVQSRNGRKGGRKNKGRHWFNNGQKQVTAFECPPGFKLGRLPRELW